MDMSSAPHYRCRCLRTCMDYGIDLQHRAARLATSGVSLSLPRTHSIGGRSLWLSFSKHHSTSKDSQRHCRAHEAPANVTPRLRACTGLVVAGRLRRLVRGRGRGGRGGKSATARGRGCDAIPRIGRSAGEALDGLSTTGAWDGRVSSAQWETGTIRRDDGTGGGTHTRG